jgi:hypothetical protein
MEARIFKPLGMADTHLHDDPLELVPRLADGYTSDGRGPRRVRPQGDVVGNAGLVTTARDLLIWERNFVEPRVGDASIVAAMQTAASLTSGAPTGFGMGLQVETAGGRRTIAHGGGDSGISAYVVRYPDHDLAVAVLCNQDGIDASGLTRGVADIYLGPASTAGPAGTPAGAPAAAAPSAAQLASFAGLYREPREDALLRIFVRDGALRGSSGAGEGDDGWPLTPLGGDRFVIPGTTIVLGFSGRTLRIEGERPVPDVLERVTPDTIDARALGAFAGQYASEELGVTYTLSVREQALVLQIPGRQPIALRSIAPDLLVGPLVGALRFTHDPAGVPAGFAIRAHGALGVRFDRVAATR